jgi:DNA-binding YbaB/EbfC family protein
MFKEFGALMGMFRNQGKIQEAFQKFEAQVAAIVAEATAGAGYVTAKVNGKMEVVSIRISEEAMKLNDREMLEDLIAAATNQALVKVRQQLAEASAKMTAEIGLPPGMLPNGLPGLS